jgi:uncharacterized protein YjbI with pentapeptide repeats
LKKVTFADCRIGRVALSGVALSEVDLSGAELSVVDGVGSLAGARLSGEQVAQLAGAFAEHLGIDVAQGS